jgi:predicted phage terminase large subunit-like protein
MTRPTIKLTAEIIRGFVSSLLQKGFDGASDIPDCHMEWWELCTDSAPLVGIAAPRGHAKSTAITFSYVLANIVFRQRDFIVIVSETEAQSILFLNDIKKELQDNEDLRTLFGFTGFTKDTESDFIGEFDDETKFRVIAKGSEQRVRGLKWSGKRPNLIVCDDLEGDEQVLNKERREKFKRWVFGALLPCRSDDGIVRVVGTILHADSFLENVMPKEHDRRTVTVGLKTYSLAAKSSWKSVKYKAHNEDFSKILWPSKKTEQWLRIERQKYVDQGLSDVYSQEFLNIPIDESRAFIKKGDLLALTDEDKTLKLNYYVGVDLAISSKQTADYSVFVLGGMDEHRVIQVRNVVRDRLQADEIIDMILGLQRSYEPQMFIIEDGQIAKTLMPSLHEEMRKQNIWPSIHLVRANTDKVSRARPLQARVRSKAVKFDKHADWWADMEDELLKFPRGRHDDQVDATSYMMQAVDRMIEAPTPNEQEEEHYLDEYNATGSDEYNGRSGITGY